MEQYRIQLPADISVREAETLYGLLERGLQSGGSILLEGDEVAHFDSTSLQQLLALKLKLEVGELSLRLVNPSGDMQRSLVLLGAGQLFES